MLRNSSITPTSPRLRDAALLEDQADPSCFAHLAATHRDLVLATQLETRVSILPEMRVRCDPGRYQPSDTGPTGLMAEELCSLQSPV